MSQLETVMLVALGFAVAALIALFVGRFAWDLAMSIGRRRAHDQAPTALIELQTERDRLRAEHAMLSRKLELKLEDYKKRVVEQMAEVSRNRNRIQNFAAEVASREAAVNDRDTQIATLKDKIASLETEAIEKNGALQQAQERVRAHDGEVVQLKGEIETLTQKLADRDRAVALLQAEVSGRPAPAEEPREAQAHLRSRIDELKELSRQIAEQRAQLKSETLPMAAGDSPAVRMLNEQGHSLEVKFAAAERDVDELAVELQKLDEKWQGRLNGEGPHETSAAVVNDAARPSERPFPSLGGVANVISLAQRIRSLKKDITG